MHPNTSEPRVGRVRAWLEEHSLPLIRPDLCSRNQLLLRLASVNLLGDDGREIEFAVKRVLNVNEPSKLGKAKASDSTQGAPFASAFPGAVELQQIQTDLHTQREDIRRIDSNGFKIVTALDKRTSRLGDEVTRLRATVSSVHREFGGLQQELGSIKTDLKKAGGSAQDPTALTGLESRLVSIASALGKLGHQLNTVDSRVHKQLDELKSEISQQQRDIEDLKSIVRTSVPAADYAQDMAALRAEMAQLRRQTEETRAQGTERVESAFPSRELEVLTTNIAKISNRASQVETLQMELEILKGRVERGEASRARTADNRQLTRAADPGPPMYSDNVPGALKRAASPTLGPVPKRPVSSLSYSDFADARYTTPPVWSAHQSPATSREDAAGHEDPPRAAGSTTGANKSRRGRSASSSTRTSTRLRKR